MTTTTQTGTVVVISGAGSGFGALTARALADPGQVVHAGIRETSGRNTDRVVADTGHPGVAVHHVGHLVQGPTEAFGPEEMARAYDTDVLSTQRLKIAAPPIPRDQGHGLVLWVGSSSTRGGTQHFASSGRPAHQDVDPYEDLSPHLLEDVDASPAAVAPPGAEVSMVADEVARVAVALPEGERPSRTFIGPADDGTEEVPAVNDRIRAEFHEHIGPADTLTVQRARSA